MTSYQSYLLICYWRYFQKELLNFQLPFTSEEVTERRGVTNRCFWLASFSLSMLFIMMWAKKNEKWQPTDTSQKAILKLYPRSHPLGLEWLILQLSVIFSRLIQEGLHSISAIALLFFFPFGVDSVSKAAGHQGL